MTWKKWIKAAAKSRQMVFSVLLAVFGAVASNTVALKPYLTPEIFGLFVMFVGVATAVLRVLTTTPLEDKVK